VFTLSSSPFISTFPHSWNSFSRYYFSIYKHVYIVFAIYSPSLSLSYHLLPPFLPLVPTVQVRPVHNPALWFCKKYIYFCLFKTATQGVFLWHFHVYMCYNPNLFISSIFLLSIFISLLQWLQQV
jgi:hypothetical protein